MFASWVDFDTIFGQIRHPCVSYETRPQDCPIWAKLAENVTNIGNSYNQFSIHFAHEAKSCSI